MSNYANYTEFMHNAFRAQSLEVANLRSEIEDVFERLNAVHDKLIELGNFSFDMYISEKIKMITVYNHPLINKTALAVLLFPELSNDPEKARKRLFARVNNNYEFSEIEKDIVRKQLVNLIKQF